MFGDLSRRFLKADFRAKINHQFIGGFAGLRKMINLNNRARADIDFGEIIIGDHGRECTGIALNQQELVGFFAAIYPMTRENPVLQHWDESRLFLIF
jgi:hypothetical protein